MKDENENSIIRVPRAKMGPPTVEELVAIGGIEWKQHDKHRVYFDDIPEWCELGPKFFYDVRKGSFSRRHLGSELAGDVVPGILAAVAKHRVKKLGLG